MKISRKTVFLLIVFMLSGCFSSKEIDEKTPPLVPQARSIVPQPSIESNKDKSLSHIAKYFEQADAIHREAWWVLTNDRRPVSKSPFGKVQRALLASENVKLANKSLFRCDRYLVSKHVLGKLGFPLKFEIYEKCSEKLAAKKIAEVLANSDLDVAVTFFSENLEEVLGLGATVLNVQTQCSLKGKSEGQLESLSCKDWAQDRSKEHLIRLDVFEYKKTGSNIIKLRGKVYENLTDIRKIEADIPLDGKIFVTETELYPPEPVAPTPTPQDTKKKVTAPARIPLPVDPDVLMMQQNQQNQEIPNTGLPQLEPIEGVPLEAIPAGESAPTGEVTPENEGERIHER